MARATAFVDSREAAEAEAGALLLARQEGAVPEGHVAAELTDVLLGRHAGRTGPAEVTLFSSVGLAVQDVAAAKAVLDAVRSGWTGPQISNGADV